MKIRLFKKMVTLFVLGCFTSVLFYLYFLRKKTVINREVALGQKASILSGWELSSNAIPHYVNLSRASQSLSQTTHYKLRGWCPVPLKGQKRCSAFKGSKRPFKLSHAVIIPRRLFPFTEHLARVVQTKR